MVEIRHLFAAVLLLAACAMCAEPALAAQGRCNPNQIRAEFEKGGYPPNVIGCRPEDVRAGLSNEDYGFNVEGSVPSDTIREGRIASQRTEPGNLYVKLSSGAPYKPEQPAGGHEGGHHGPKIGSVIGGIIGVLANLPPPDRQPQVPPTDTATPPPPPVDAGPAPYTPPAPVPQPVPVAPEPAPQPAPPPPTVATATPPPAPTPPPPKPATKPAKNQLAQDTPQAGPKATDTPPKPQKKIPTPEPKATPVIVPPAPVPEPAPIEDRPPPTACPDGTFVPAGMACLVPPPTRFSIAAGPNVRKGDELTLVIRRENNDGKLHLVALNYSDPALLDSPPTTFAFGSDLPDRVTLKLRTKAKTKNKGNHDLAVTLASASSAEVGRPDSVMAVILDRTPWWKKLLERLASLPLWAAALAGAVVVAAGGVGVKLLMPRATCSIEPGKVGIGRAALRSCWPALRVDAVIGDPSFSIPRPLPIGRLQDAKLRPV